MRKLKIKAHWEEPEPQGRLAHYCLKSWWCLELELECHQLANDTCFIPQKASPTQP